MKKVFLLITALLFTVFAVSACSDEKDPVTVAEDTVIIDVRTAQEFAAGHLDGAINLDWNGGEFSASLADLDPNVDYLLYCKSGNRAGQALTAMSNAGFAKVTNLGSLQQASDATGIRIIQ